MSGKFFMVVYIIGVLGSVNNLFNSNSYEERLGWFSAFFYAVSAFLCQIELNQCKKKNDEEESE
jgi:hypothetical protein